MKVGIGLLFVASLLVAGLSLTTENQRRSVAQTVGLPDQMAQEAERQLSVFIDWATGETPHYEERDRNDRGRDI